MANAVDPNQQNQVPIPYLARACEAAVSIVQNCVGTNENGAESVVQYGGDVSSVLTNTRVVANMDIYSQ